MISKIIEKLKNKKIGILGFAREGKATLHFIERHHIPCTITLLDQNPIEEESYEKITGPTYLDHLDCYDIIIKTPGISLNHLNLKDEIKKKITSELELLLETNKENCIGITGTKGKSTTSSLLYEVIKKQKNDVVFAGNIGIPLFDVLDESTSSTLFVMEMSSHQLEYLKTSPHIGVILNLFQDHLDHAKTVEHYYACKANMFRYQNENDYMIYCKDNYELNKLIEEKNFKGQRITVSYEDNQESTTYRKENKIYFNEENIYDINDKRNLIGKHNTENIMVVLTIAKILGLSIEQARKTINEFKGLPYRLENIGSYDNITYYRDTLATIPEATIEALESLKEVNTLILGGMDRGIDYQPLINYLNTHFIPHLICMPTTGYKIAEQLSKKEGQEIYKIDTLEKAVEVAKKVTKKNTICLLSPAASSYEQFKDYAEKGDKFLEYVKRNY